MWVSQCGRLKSGCTCCDVSFSRNFPSGRFLFVSQQRDAHTLSDWCQMINQLLTHTHPLCLIDISILFSQSSDDDNNLFVYSGARADGTRLTNTLPPTL
jgi:hypothetical protein